MTRSVEKCDLRPGPSLVEVGYIRLSRRGAAAVQEGVRCKSYSGKATGPIKLQKNADGGLFCPHTSCENHASQK